LLSGPRFLTAVAALLILLSVVAVSILVARIATRAFMLTGLSKETARFQARSIITGTGFTTDEAEHIVNHPVRRRIALTLMLIGNAGLVTAVSTFVLSFTSTGTAAEALQRGLVLAAGLGVLAIERPDGTVDYAPGADDCVPPDGCVIVYGPEEQIISLCDQLRCNFDPTEEMSSA